MIRNPFSITIGCSGSEPDAALPAEPCVRPNEKSSYGGVVKKIILVIVFLFLLVNSVVAQNPKPNVPSDTEINTWWKPENREDPKERFQVNRCTFVRLVTGEEAFLASVFFLDRGRNAFGGSLLVRPKLREAREIKGIGEDFETIGLLNGASLISAKTVGSGQGTTAGQKTLLKLDGWKSMVLHKSDFGDNLGECGSVSGRRCHSEDTHWIFTDLNGDEKMDLVEVSVTQDGPEANRLAWRTVTRVYLLKEGKYVVAPVATIRTGKAKPQ
jgi:hypothetical protein